MSQPQRHTPTNYLANCRADDTAVEEYFVDMSDGMSLKVIDFLPNNGEPSDKPWLLFLPGWLSQINNWSDFLKEITPHYRVLYVESREKRSSVPPMVSSVSYDIERFTADAKEVIELLIPADQPWVLAASSLGSSVGLEYLATPNRKPAHAMLIAPNLIFALPSWSKPIFRWIPTVLFPILQQVIKLYIRLFKVDMKNERQQYIKYANTIDAADPVKLRPNALSLFDYDGWHTLEKITTPVLLVGGKTDQMHGLNELEQAAAMNENCELFLMESNKATHSDKAGNRLKQLLDSVWNASTDRQKNG